MKRFVISLMIGGVVLPLHGHAQTAKVDVTVTPTSAASAAGFTVCIGSSANRSLYGSGVTPASGVVEAPFQNLSAGETVVVTANKSGFAGKDVTITLQPGRNNHVTLSPSAGSGGPACSGTVTAPPAATSPPPAPPPAAVATTITPMMSTSTYAGKAGAPMTYGPPMTVTVRDQNNNPLAGVNVAFTVTGGGGSMNPLNVATKSDGTARPDTWTLGNTPGLNTATATASGLTPAPLKVYGALSVSSIEAASVTSQEAVAGGSVQLRPTVLVRDQFHNPMSGAPVTFAVVSGGGNVSPASTSTGPTGIATVSSWTLGLTPGANSITAKTISGLPPVTFAANATDAYTLTVLVKRADGTAVQNAQVCIGSRSDVDQYATVKSGGTYGQAVFNLPGAGEYGITAAKAGYVGKTSYLPVVGTSGSATLTLASGSGGVTCPGMAIEYETITSVAISPDPAPARLGEEALAIAGKFPFNTSYIKQLDCKQFGTSAVMIGLKGRHGTAVDEINVLCELLQKDGTLSTSVLATERWDNWDSAGEQFERKCVQGFAVSGATFTMENTQLRSIVLQCKKVGSTGLTSGSALSLAPIGIPVSSLPSTSCTSGRPARAMKSSFDQYNYPIIGQSLAGPWIIVTAQLFCEQPVKP